MTENNQRLWLLKGITNIPWTPQNSSMFYKLDIQIKKTTIGDPPVNVIENLTNIFLAYEDIGVVIHQPDETGELVSFLLDLDAFILTNNKKLLWFGAIEIPKIDYDKMKVD